MNHDMRPLAGLKKAINSAIWFSRLRVNLVDSTMSAARRCASDMHRHSGHPRYSHRHAAPFAHM